MTIERVWPAMVNNFMILHPTEALLLRGAGLKPIQINTIFNLHQRALFSQRKKKKLEKKKRRFSQAQ